MDNSKLKSTARKRLEGNYSVVVLSLLLFMVLGGCCSFIAIAINAPWISSLLMFVVESLLMMGFVGIILKISRGKKVQLEDLFSRTDLFDKYIIITLLLGLASFIIWLLGYLAFKSLLMIVLYQSELNLFLTILLVIFGLFLTVAIIMVGVYLAIALSQTYFILYDEPKLSIGQILSKSFDMMADYILEYFVLVLSFIGWLILGIFTFGILYLWLIPYMLVTLALFYDKVKKTFEETTGEEEQLVKEAPKKVVSKPKTATKKTTTTAKKTTKPAAKKSTTATKKATTAIKKAPAKTTAKKATTATKKTSAKTTVKKATTTTKKTK